jgi:hypothetical protein
LELFISTGEAAATKRQRESASRASITPIDLAKFSAGYGATKLNCDPRARASKRFTRTHA